MIPPANCMRLLCAYKHGFVKVINEYVPLIFLMHLVQQLALLSSS